MRRFGDRLEEKEMAYQLDYEKGIANIGNLDRMKKLLAHAESGDPIVLGFLGGSITQGSLASAPESCYAYRVYEWWRRTFPQTVFTYVNAGIGGTDSQFGVARAEHDLLCKKPDFVILEFSVNDESTEHFMETYEGLVRRVYGAAWEPAVLLVHNVYYHNGANAQVIHACVGRHYGLPAVSMQSAVYPEVVAGRIGRREITPDDLHPNDKGHELVASVIAWFLEQMRKGVISGDVHRTDGLPAPLTKNAYERSVRWQNDNADPVMEGFAVDIVEQQGITDCFKKGWTASKTGDKITFDVEGSCIAVQYRKSVRHPAPVAEAVVDGDTEHAVRLDANFDETWGDKLELTTVLEHGEKRAHRVEIRLIETHEDDVAPFYLVSLISS